MKAPDGLGMDTTRRVAMAEVLEEFRAERQRQHASHGEQDLPDGTGGAYAEHACESAHEDYQFAVMRNQLTFAHILAEEFWEVLAEPDQVKLRTELVQLGAVCAQWVEAIDRRHKL